MKILHCANEKCQKELTGNQTKYCCIKCKNKCSNEIYQTTLKQKERGITRKIELVKLGGGGCSNCHYSNNLSVLEFHHINPEEKDDGLDMANLCNRSWDWCLKEFEKCIILCSNCHRELHNPHLNSFMEKIKTDITSMSFITRKSTEDRETCQTPHLCLCGKKIKLNKDKCNQCIRKERTIELETCECGNTKHKNSETCRDCFLYLQIGKGESRLNTRKAIRPSKEELEKLIWKKPMIEIAKDFGVSDVSIKKWCNSYGIVNRPGVGYWQKSKTKTLT